MAKTRTYVWKEQIRDNPTEEWSDYYEPATVRISDKGITYGYHGEYTNAFEIKDGGSIPDNVFRIAGHLPSKDYHLRQILEAKDDDGKPIIKVVKEYPKQSDVVITSDNTAVVFAKCRQCGEKLVPQRAQLHLKQVHEMRQQVVNKIDYTNEKYFEIIAEHGTKAREGVSVKALRKGKLKSAEL